MQYHQIIQYLHEQLPMFHRVGPAAYKANLDNTLALSKYFNYPERNFKSVHIAGTNGKGSVAHMLASVLQEKGLKTGLCTSPHLKDFRERIKINGQMITKEYICDFFNNNIDFINKTSPSFFELTIALTFKYFSDEKVDIAVVETGMGGRLDSTNIITPLVSVITNIGLDHTNLLGDTIEKIANEKAGIIKPEVPVIIGREQKNISNIFNEKASENNCDLFFADEAYDVSPVAQNNNIAKGRFEYIVNTADGGQYTLEVGLGGSYQKENIATVLKCADVLNESTKMDLTYQQVSSGLRNVVDNTGLMGRWQILGTRPLIICDTGHNPDAIRSILNQLRSITYKKLHIVIGMMNDKSIPEILDLLPGNAKYYFTNANVPRAIDAKTLKQTASNHNLVGEAYDTVERAFDAAKNCADEGDLIFVGGSTFIVAEVV